MSIVNEVLLVVKSKAELATEHRLGWLVYAEGMPADVCGTATMMSGWLQALRDEAQADAGAFIERIANDTPAWAGDYGDVLPDYQRDDYIGT